MALKYSDKASTLITSNISETDTVFTINSAVTFPSGISATDYCIATISNLENTVLETIKITDISGNIVTAERSYGRSSGAFIWPSGSILEIRLNSTLIDEIISAATPAGLISLWSGALNAIPTGWSLCDGSNGTPNLTDKFIMGAGSGYEVGDTGGSADAIVPTHTHPISTTVTDEGHFHYTAVNSPSGPNINPTLSAETYNSYQGYGGSGGYNEAYSLQGLNNEANVGKTNDVTTGITVETTITATGVSTANANLPPYYALAYIMKL